MKKIKLIGDSILAYMPKLKLKGIEEKHAIENAETALLRKLYPKYKNSSADINVFCLGINDYFRQYYDEDFKKMTTEEILVGLTEFIDEIKEDNNGKLIVLSLFPIRETKPWDFYFSEIRKEIPKINNALMTYCMKNDINFIDAYPYFADENGVMREDLSDDGIHPNQNVGYDVLAKLINDEMQKIEQQELSEVIEKI